MKNLWNSLRLFLWMTFITGIVYPLFIWGIAQLMINQKANGNFIVMEGKPIGSVLIAQKFEAFQYFWGRPSAIDYNPIPSGGSNLGPTSALLKKAVDDRIAVILKSQDPSDHHHIPSELLFTSGSGIDPHISPETAFFQIDRILKARKMDQKIGKQQLINLIEKFTEKRRFGFLGDPVVNVLQLNLALDHLTKAPHNKN